MMSLLALLHEVSPSPSHSFPTRNIALVHYERRYSNMPLAGYQDTSRALGLLVYTLLHAHQGEKTKLQGRWSSDSNGNQ